MTAKCGREAGRLMFVVQYNREREKQTFNCKMEEHMDMLSGNINKTENVPNA